MPGSDFTGILPDQEWLVPHFEKMLYDQALLPCLLGGIPGHR